MTINKNIETKTKPTKKQMEQVTNLDEAWDIYLNGDYVFEVPPVCTRNWDDGAWLKWIFPNINWKND